MTVKDRLLAAFRAIPGNQLTMINPIQMISMKGHTEEELDQAIKELVDQGIIVPFYLYYDEKDREFEINPDDIDWAKSNFVHPEKGTIVHTVELFTYYSVDTTKLSHTYESDKRSNSKL